VGADDNSWDQTAIVLPAFPRGFHLITHLLDEAMPSIRDVRMGLLNVFIQHTSASLTINENADPDVQIDLENSFRAIVSEDLPYIHTIEGPDDMPAHVKSSMIGSSVTVPIRDGRMALGTWQGIYLCEHRNRGGRRHLILTLQGQRSGGKTRDTIDQPRA
jgi:secondary thiamine-phosphate synthase enzyme